MRTTELERSRGWMAFILMLLPFSAAMSRWLSISPGAASFPYVYRILIAGLAVWIFVDVFSTARQTMMTWLAIAFTIAAGTWGILSVQWSLDPATGMQKTIGLTLQGIALVAVVKLIARKPGDIVWMKYGVVAAALVECAIATWEVRTLTHLSDLVGQEWLFSYRDWPVGTFVNPNNLAAFLTFATAVSFSIVFTDRSTWMRLLSIITIIWSLFVIVDARSLAMVMVYSMIVAAYLLWMVRKHIGWLLMILLTAATGMSVLAAGEFISLGEFFSRVVDENQSTSLASRLNTYIYAGQLLLDSYGLGIGPGSYEIFASGLTSRLAEENLPLLNPHNTILELFLAYGLLVAVPLMLLTLAAFFIFLRAFLSRFSQPVRALGLEGLAGFLAILVASVVASSLMIETSWWMSISYLVALSSVVRLQMRREAMVAQLVADDGRHSESIAPASTDQHMGEDVAAVPDDTDLSSVVPKQPATVAAG